MPPCFGVRQDNPPYTVGAAVSPVRGGHKNIRASHGPRQAPMTNARIQYSVFRIGVTTHPALRRRKMIEALTRGRMGVYSKLYAMRIYRLSVNIGHCS